MVTLEEPYKANDDMGPICLPGKDHQDMGVKVVTAGWGFTRVSGSCRTNGRGPQTFKECAQGAKCEKKKEVPNSDKCLELVKQISAE